MAYQFKFSAQVKYAQPITTDFVWVKVNLWAEQGDETTAHPSISIDVPVPITGETDSLSELFNKAKGKAKVLLSEALEQEF